MDKVRNMDKAKDTPGLAGSGHGLDPSTIAIIQDLLPNETQPNVRLYHGV